MLNTEPYNFFFSTLQKNLSVILWPCLHYSAGYSTKNPDIAVDGLWAGPSTCRSCWNVSSIPENPIAVFNSLHTLFSSWSEIPFKTNKQKAAFQFISMGMGFYPVPFVYLSNLIWNFEAIENLLYALETCSTHLQSVKCAFFFNLTLSILSISPKLLICILWMKKI